MELQPDCANQIGHGAAAGAHPWWCGGVLGIIPPATVTDSGTSSSVLAMAGGAGAINGQFQLQHGVDDKNDPIKEAQSTGTNKDRSIGQKNKSLQPVSSVIPPMMPEYLAPPTQLEHGQSIACATYSYADPYFAHLVAPYGTQALIAPHLLGTPHTRMPLPPEMTEEPVYVNAKQYHGILRRRQSRAKAELERKVVKARKPYLHESRHQHAMRRARGCGGRFLNTKKNDDGDAEENTCRGIQSAGSDTLPSDCSSNREQIPHSSANGRDVYQQQAGFQMSFHQKPGERSDEGDCTGQQWDGIMLNESSRRTVTIQ